VTRANIYTVDRQHPKAEAVAVIGDRIVAVGSKAEIDTLRGPQSRVIDAHGKLLLPGFNDAHVLEVFRSSSAAMTAIRGWRIQRP
jgi:predicted amidohydrolase YtcJ